MDKNEALRRLDSATREHAGHRIATALQYGNSIEDVAARLGLTPDALVEQYGLATQPRSQREQAA